MQDKCPCWWEGPDGSRVLMMYTCQYAQAAQWALTESFEAARAAGAGEAASYESRDDYPFDAVFLHGAVSDNQPLERPAGRGRQAVERALRVSEDHPLAQRRFLPVHREALRRQAARLPRQRGHVLGGRGRLVGPGDGPEPQRPRALANGEKFLALADRIGTAESY